MRLRDLQDRLRAHIRARISRRELTGSDLSRQAGFQQGHLSNFLNARRGLSLESMDRLLETLQIEVLDLVDAAEIQRRALLPPGVAGLESIAIVSPEHAARLPRFTSEQVGGTVTFRKSFLRRLKPNDICDRGDWLRFVSIQLDPKTVRVMFPRSAGGRHPADRPALHFAASLPPAATQPVRRPHAGPLRRRLCFAGGRPSGVTAAQPAIAGRTGAHRALQELFRLHRGPGVSCGARGLSPRSSAMIPRGISCLLAVRPAIKREASSHGGRQQHQCGSAP